MIHVKTNDVLSSLFSVSTCKSRCCILGSAATAWRRKAQTNHWLKLSILGRGWNSLFAFFCWRFYFRTYRDNAFACWFRDVSSIGEGSLISGTRQLLKHQETIFFCPDQQGVPKQNCTRLMPVMPFRYVKDISSLLYATIGQVRMTPSVGWFRWTTHALGDSSTWARFGPFAQLHLNFARKGKRCIHLSASGSHLKH